MEAKPLSDWSVILGGGGEYYFQVEKGAKNQMLRMAVLKEFIKGYGGVVVDQFNRESTVVRFCSNNGISDKGLVGRVKHLIIILVEPCFLSTIDIPNVSLVCLSFPCYMRFKTVYKHGPVYYMSDPILRISRDRTLKLLQGVRGEGARTESYEVVMMRLNVGFGVTWVNPPLYLREEMTRMFGGNARVMNKLQFESVKIPVYMVVLFGDSGRVDHVRSKLMPKLGGLGICCPEIVKAVNGRKSGVLQTILKETGVKVSAKGLKTGQIGCALSHYKVWDRMLKNQDQYCVVLEDDSCITSEFQEGIQGILSEVPFYFDWVYLYIFPKHFKDGEKEQIAGKKWLNRAYFTYCTVGYLISRSGAKKMMNRLKNLELGGLDKPIDTIVCEEISEGRLKAYCSRKVIVDNLGQQTSDAGDGGKFVSNIWSTGEWQSGK